MRLTAESPPDAASPPKRRRTRPVPPVSRSLNAGSRRPAADTLSLAPPPDSQSRNLRIDAYQAPSTASALRNAQPIRKARHAGFAGSFKPRLPRFPLPSPTPRRFPDPRLLQRQPAICANSVNSSSQPAWRYALCRPARRPHPWPPSRGLKPATRKHRRAFHADFAAPRPLRDLDNGERHLDRNGLSFTRS